MQVGDFIKVNKGVVNPHDSSQKIAYWTGKVKEIKQDSNNAEPSIVVEWDIQTLRKISIGIIKNAVEDN